MGIFTGSEILFFMLGALSTLSAGGLTYLNMKFSLGWKILSIGAAGSLLLLFCLAWSFSSILEGEPQAANMGFLIFGIPVLLIFASMQRMIKSKITENRSA